MNKVLFSEFEPLLTNYIFFWVNTSEKGTNASSPLLLFFNNDGFADK